MQTRRELLWKVPGAGAGLERGGSKAGRTQAAERVSPNVESQKQVKLKHLPSWAKGSKKPGWEPPGQALGQSRAQSLPALAWKPLLESEHSRRPGFSSTLAGTARPARPSLSGQNISPSRIYVWPSSRGQEACLSDHQPCQEQRTGQLPAQLCLSAKLLTTHTLNSLTPGAAQSCPRNPHSQGSKVPAIVRSTPKGPQRLQCPQLSARPTQSECEVGGRLGGAESWELWSGPLGQTPLGNGLGGHHQLRHPAPGLSVIVGLPHPTHGQGSQHRQEMEACESSPGASAGPLVKWVSGASSLRVAQNSEESGIL